ncbi:hypothetical protein HF086_002257 [Spodoptera exigua]|uniref:BESS domain-containing protein n=1 Tax=Spodoptera exigua TaxID=7107 RepID=A0A922SHG5_SPOEX|nr:hypothetical protein HF086_002257 [Spodoptera exigua]
MSDNKTLQLVKAIEKFPCLYNYNIPECLKKEFSDRAWQEVASQTQLSDTETDEEINGYNEQDNESTPLQIQYHEIEIPEPPKKKSKANDNLIRYLQQKPSNTLNNNEVSDDSRKMFLLSLLPEVNALTECQMRVFRRKIFSLLDEIVDSPSQYETCLFQWQKESINPESHKNSETIKKEPL